MLIDVIRDDSHLVRKTIETHHYLRSWPDPRSLPFAYRLLVNGSGSAADGRPHGIVVFKKPQHHKQQNLFGYSGLPTSWQVLDMARVWVHPAWQITDAQGHSFCMFTRMVSKCLRQVQMDWLQHHPPRFPELPYQIELIVSYCQLAHHDGTAYKAASFEPFGLTLDKQKEIFIKRLRPRRKQWRIEDFAAAAQMPLLNGIGIKY